jgi:hypothetical protein
MLASTGSRAFAHGFGERYDLPLPLSFYLFGVAGAVALSFLIVAWSVRDASAASRLSARRAPDALTALITGRVMRGALKLITLVLFTVTIAAGFIGDQSPYRNIAPTMVWIIGWIGIAYFSALVGDVWAAINPWRTVFDVAAWLTRRLAGWNRLSVGLRYPRVLGVWPAVLLLLAFSWIELVYPNPAVPHHIACFAVGYSLLTLIGMLLFGRDVWLAHAEVFSVVFGTFARFAPTQVKDGEMRQLWIRPYGAGLLDSTSLSHTVFVLLLLSTVLFDGVLATPGWTAIESSARSFLDANDTAVVIPRTLGLIASWAVFVGLYFGVAALMSAVTAGRLSAIQMARAFALTLVPIAIGYHVAHYFTVLLVQGQYIVPLLSDPFGYGWNLFGTGGYRIDIGFVGARFAWYAALTSVLLGHVAAVYFAHRRAMLVLDHRAAVLRSQVPLTALMVLYTLVSLSILAEPIVERREPAAPSVAVREEVSVPADALAPEPGSGRLLPVGPGKTAKGRLTYRMLGSSFHDGTRTSAADLLYAYAFAYRWSGRADDARAHYDPLVDRSTAPLRERLIAVRVAGREPVSRTFRVADVDFVREIFQIEVYLTMAPGRPEREAVFAPWSTLPWHVLALMEQAVERGFAAFSQEEAARRGVEWLDLVRSEPQKERFLSLVEAFEREGFRPEALRSMVSGEEARRRWSALAAFYRTHHHFLVTNGPYRLKSWSSTAAVLDAFRDLSYPLGVGSYDAYAVPRRGYITGVEQQGSRISLAADIEVMVRFQRSYRLERKPFATVAPDVARRSAPECRYVIVDAEGRVRLTGRAGPAENGTFVVDLGGRLSPGRYTMLAQVVVNWNAMGAEVRAIPLVVP